MEIIRKCEVCKKEGKELRDEICVVTTKGDEICWPCVADAVDYYKDALKEGE